MSEKKIPVIIDCDPGHDDAIAITLCLANPQFDVKGIVTVAGNQTIDNTTRNAGKILAFLGRSDIPVIKGAGKPILQEGHPAAAHGVSGMDGPSLPDPAVPPLDINATEFYRKILSESEEPVTIVPVGPLTNIAILLATHPELKSKIKCFNIMGGGCFFTPELYTNITPMAEFNIWHDAYAAEMFFRENIPVNMFGLDVTHRCGANDADIEHIRANGGRVGKVVAQLLDFYSISHRKSGMLETAIHDACPVAYMIDPTLFTGSHHHVRIDLVGENTFGATIADMRGKGYDKKRPFEDKAHQNVNIITGVNKAGMLELILKACQSYD